MNDTRRALLAPWQTAVLLAFVALGAASFALGVGIGGAGVPGGMQRSLSSLLLSNFYFLSLSLVAAVLIAIHYLVAAGWFVVLRRVLESMTAYLPTGALLMMAVLLGLPHLYHWAGEAAHHDGALASKAAYLNSTGFIVRMVGFLAIWLWLAHRMVRESRLQDETGDLAHTSRNRRRSGVFAVVFALTFTLATVDWLMSLEAEWYSTLFPWYVFSSVLVAGLCWTVMLVAWLRRSGVLPQVNEHHMHDLGKYVFAFSMFWGYLWYCQYMLIWYANIPEEVTHYILREHHGWNTLFLVNAAVNVILPFFVLLPAVHKKNPRILVACCAVLALSHWLDLYLLVMPSSSAAGPRFGLTEVGIFLGTAALFLLRFDRSLRGASPVPTKDPYLEESLHHAG
ncbi:MAG: hypothetical protein AAB434_04205 [Planctomycetota bacterium]|mgnify:CR=1 FL=1